MPPPDGQRRPHQGAAPRTTAKKSTHSVTPHQQFEAALLADTAVPPHLVEWSRGQAWACHDMLQLCARTMLVHDCLIGGRRAVRFCPEHGCVNCAALAMVDCPACAWLWDLQDRTLGEHRRAQAAATSHTPGQLTRGHPAAGPTPTLCERLECFTCASCRICPEQRRVCLVCRLCEACARWDSVATFTCTSRRYSRSLRRHVVRERHVWHVPVAGESLPSSVAEDEAVTV